jgi:hypothetical protein
MKTAVDALTNLSLDPEAQRIAWERDRNERAARHMMGSAIQAGREEGRAESRREKAAMLTRLLAKKFGPLAEAQGERVEGADGATLNRWFDAFLDAVSIDELFRV